MDDRTATLCPSPGQLEQLASGRLSSSAADLLMAHVRQCSGCAHRFEEQRANAALASDIAEALGSDYASLALRSESLVASADEEEPSPPDGHAPPLPEWAALRDSMPGYDIIREIHRGGQGVVYEAIQQSTRRTVAIKVMVEGPFASDRSKWRFEREVKLVAGLKHPHIVVIHDSGIAQNKYFYVMDYVRGQPLDTHVRLTRPSVRDLAGLYLQVCDAVAYAHRRGVIHRDLKPSNILVGDDGKPQVLDFGLAKLVGEDRQESRRSLTTMTGQLMGTLRYMSPEQTMGDPGLIDVRTDVYTLGVILYELLTETPPYATNTELTAALRSIREADPPRPSRLRHEVKSELEAVVLKAMHKEPARRYQSAGEMRDDLLAWLEGRPVTAKSDSAFYVLRKLAARHYFHTSVVTALLVSILAFAGISYHYYGQASEALRRKLQSDENARITRAGIDDFFNEGREAFRQQALGWFLLEWQAGRTDRARDIMHRLNPASPEVAVMNFMLDGRQSIDHLRGLLPPSAGGLLHFVAGERYLKMGQTGEALRELELSAATTEPQYEWYRQSALARLAELRPATTSPGAP